MQKAEVTSTKQWKRGDSPEILFMGLEAPFKLQSVTGGKIEKVTVENGYHWDGWGRDDNGQYQLFRHGTFTLTVKVIIPNGEAFEVLDNEHRAIA